MGRWTREELEEAFDKYNEHVAKAAAVGKWEIWTDACFTEDVTYEDPSFGVLGGRDAVARWMNGLTQDYPMSEMKHFPSPWHIVDVERGWVVCEFRNRMRDPGDGTVHEVYNYAKLHYAGGGRFNYQRDAYDWSHVGPMLEGWQKARARCEDEASEA